MSRGCVAAVLAPPVAALALIACGTTPSAERGQEAAATPPAQHEHETATRIADRMLETIRLESGVPGLAAAVATGDEVVWTGTSGWADLAARQPVTPGARLEQLLASRIFAPAGLREITLEDVRSLPPSSVTLYDVGPGAEPVPIAPGDQSYARGATGMRASARDVARFGARFLAGTIVGAKTRDRALRPSY